MATFKTYITLLRVSNLPTVWSNVTAAVLLCGSPFSPAPLPALILSLSLMYSGGMALNDVCDAAIDREQRPDRPIPSGRIMESRARLLTTLLFVAALVLLLTLPFGARALGAGVLLMGIIIWYDLRHKNNPLSVLLMAGCRFMVYLVAGCGVAGGVSALVALLGAIQFAYITLVSLVARNERRIRWPFKPPLVPLLLAGICLVDGTFVAVALASPLWIAAGVGGSLLTLFGQRYVRGD